MSHNVDPVHQTDATASLSAPADRTPEFNIGDEVTKVKLQYRVQSSIGRTFMEEEEETDYDDRTKSMTFIVAARYYNEKMRSWCYLGRASTRFQVGQLDDFGVWAWDWEITKAKFEVGQLVRARLADEFLPARIRSIDWRPEGVCYDLYLGLAEFKEEDTEVVGYDGHGGRIFGVRRKGLAFCGPCDYKEDRGEFFVLGLDLCCSGVPQDAVSENSNEMQVYVPSVRDAYSAGNEYRVPPSADTIVASTQIRQSAKSEEQETLLAGPRSLCSLLQQPLTAPVPDHVFDRGEVAVVYYHDFGPKSGGVADTYSYSGKVSFGKVVSACYCCKRIKWEYSFELFDVVSEEGEEIELDVDRQLWLREAETARPLVRYGLVKNGTPHKTQYHAGDLVIAAFRDGMRIESRVQRVSLKLISSEVQEFYDLASKEGRFGRISGSCAVKAGHAYDAETGLLGNYGMIQQFKEQVKRWHAGEQDSEPQADPALVPAEIAILPCPTEQATEN